MTAAEVQVKPDGVRFRPEIEPLVRLLEETPRDRLLEEVAGRIRRGLTYQEALAALMLAGVRNVQPRPHVGFKFHAVLVVHSAHLASLASPDSDRWLPLFWALDYFKSAQARDREEGDWTLRPVEEASLPPAHKARAAFIDAMEKWDEPAVDAAVAALARSAGAHQVYELFFRYGARDFRSIGHKAIYVANSFRTLQVIGWQHAEPVLRSLAYALLATEGDDPKGGTSSADQPWRDSLELARRIRSEWVNGRDDPSAAQDLLRVLREANTRAAGQHAVELLDRGISAASVWDGLFAMAGELLMRKPGIIALHAVTSMNAMHFACQAAAEDETRRLLLLQAAAFLVRFRDTVGSPRHHASLDALQATDTAHEGPSALEAIFADISRDRMAAARKTLAYLQAGGEPRAFMDHARRLVFLKGNDSHDYKFSSAVLEDWHHLSTGWAQRHLAASVFALRGSGDRDNTLVERTRAALK